MQREIDLDKAKLLKLESDRFKQGMSESAKIEIGHAKLKHRSNLKLQDWNKYRYIENDWCQQLIDNCPDQIKRIHYKDLSTQQFLDNYDKPKIPLIIQGLDKKYFNIDKNWTFQKLYENYKDEVFKVGEDDNGKKIRIKFKYYLEYLVHQKDDSPLYLFESSLEDRKLAKNMLKNFKSPKYFREDILGNLGTDRRPPFRWFLIGPQRSGTTVHQDPLNTSAWNFSLQGIKRWVLFPKHVPKSIVKGKEFYQKGYDDEGLNYFKNILPKILAKEGQNVEAIEFLQKPGDMVFVPGEWWHAVVNVTDTMAMTQNMVSSGNFIETWQSIRKERKKLSETYLRKLKKNNQSLYKQAIQCSIDDEFQNYSKQDKKFFDKDNFDLTSISDEDKLLTTLEKKIKYYDSDSSSSSSSSSDSSSEESSKSYQRKRSRSRSFKKQ